MKKNVEFVEYLQVLRHLTCEGILPIKFQGSTGLGIVSVEK